MKNKHKGWVKCDASQKGLGATLWVYKIFPYLSIDQFKIVHIQGKDMGIVN